MTRGLRSADLAVTSHKVPSSSCVKLSRMFALALGTLPEDFLLQPDRIAADVAQRTDQWVSKPFAAAQGLSAAEFRATYLGVLDDALELARTDVVEASSDPLPPAYDWRTNASYATCVGPVVDQLKCGSCWAVSAAETFSDRHCVANRARASANFTRLEMSALDLIACDKECKSLFSPQCNRGCQGGYPELAWKYLKEKGIVSADCMPYNLTKQLLCPLPSCRPPHDHTLHKARSYKHILGGADAVRHELLTGGPVQATFTVFEDFMTYSGGVYKYVTGRKLGLHAVKVVGYGVTENGTEFWSAMNSWGTSFGVNGTFLIKVGECGFESGVYAGKPCVEAAGDFCL